MQAFQKELRDRVMVLNGDILEGDAYEAAGMFC